MTDSPTVVKCLAWDLDNTVWDGVLSEGDDVQVRDGVRDVIIELDRRGILNSIASKNDHDVAWERLEALGLAEYFVRPMIGWAPKSQSVRQIAEALNFAPSAIAFVDDEPTERAEVTHELPEVRTFRHDEIAALLGLPDFSPATVTVDSRNRRAMYQAGAQREIAQQEFSGPTEEFLRSLELTMTIEPATEELLARVEELTLRTSQMNATGVHYSAAVLRGLIADPDHDVVVVSMGDRFGSHGAVGVVLLHRSPQVWRLKLLATSCRVVSFGAGTAILDWVIDSAARAGVELCADFRRTGRNRMMEVAYLFAGFTETEEAAGDGAASGAADPEAISRLSLVPTPRSVPGHLTLVAPDLGASRLMAAAGPSITS